MLATMGICFLKLGSSIPMIENCMSVTIGLKKPILARPIKYFRPQHFLAIDLTKLLNLTYDKTD